MNEKELIGKIHSSMYHQLQVRGYAAPVDVLIDTGILPKQKYEDWRFGRVRYLDAVCNANLKRLSFVLHQMRVYAQAHDLKPSFCYYKRLGVRRKNGIGHKRSFRCNSAKAAARRSSGAMPPISSIWHGCRNSKRRSRKQNKYHPCAEQKHLLRAVFLTER